MSAIQVQGLRPLNGKLKIQGSKNAVLPMMAGALLIKGTTIIRNVPAITDVFSMIGILESLGCPCSFLDGVLTIDTEHVTGTGISEDFVGKMRSSLLVLGPLLARMGEAATYYPGGCVIGKRPIDLHLYALKALGAEFFEACGMILAWSKGFHGQTVEFPYPSVGATENALLAAVTAKGTTTLKNCAREPEIVELCLFLKAAGARILGAGGKVIEIEGVPELSPCEFELGGDRICAGTYLTAAMMTRGDVTVSGVCADYLEEPLSAMERMGARVLISRSDLAIRVIMEGRPEGVRICTGPYPEFPTDLQSVFLAAACISKGKSSLTEKVFEARFAAAYAMRQFGAQIRIEKDTALVHGTYPLRPAIADAPDLRGGAALILAALVSEGRSVIGKTEHIERGYEDICRDLRALGAEIE